MLYTILTTERLFHKHSGDKYDADEIEAMFNQDFNNFINENVHKCECCGYYFIGDGISNPELSREQVERGNKYDLLCKECFAASKSFFLDTIPFYSKIAFECDSSFEEESLFEGGYYNGN